MSLSCQDLHMTRSDTLDKEPKCKTDKGTKAEKSLLGSGSVHRRSVSGANRHKGIRQRQRESGTKTGSNTRGRKSQGKKKTLERLLLGDKDELARKTGSVQAIYTREVEDERGTGVTHQGSNTVAG